MSTKKSLPPMRHYTEGDIPEGWSRVGAALADRLPWSVVPQTRDEWKNSRFSATVALAFICDHDVLAPRGVEAWQADTGLDHP